MPRRKRPVQSIATPKPKRSLHASHKEHSDVSSELDRLLESKLDVLHERWQLEQKSVADTQEQADALEDVVTALLFRLFRLAVAFQMVSNSSGSARARLDELVEQGHIALEGMIPQIRELAPPGMRDSIQAYLSALVDSGETVMLGPSTDGGDLIPPPELEVGDSPFPPSVTSAADLLTRLFPPEEPAPAAPTALGQIDFDEDIVMDDDEY